MFNPLREKLADCLARQHVCVLSTHGPDGMWAIPVHCRSHGLELDCLVPRWADAAFYLEQDSRLLLIMHSAEAGALRWLQYRGTAQAQAVPDWAAGLPEEAGNRPEERYLSIHVMPSRIDLIDESQGWGVLESLEFAAN
jgi:hypothetical protein